MGFSVEIYLNQTEPLFIDGVRNPVKKQVMRLAHEVFMELLKRSDVQLHLKELYDFTLWWFHTAVNNYVNLEYFI